MMVSETKKKYKHFTARERYKLEALVEKRHGIIEISKVLNKHRVTVYREIKRGKVKLINSELIEVEKYRADVAQADYESKTSNRERTLKIGKDHGLEEYIRRKIKKDKYSPDAIIGEIKSKGLNFEGMISTKTLYNYIARGLFNGISSKALWERGRRKKKGSKKPRISLNNRSGTSIEERSEAINNREQEGHWEGDCVKGPKGKSKDSLFTLTERKTREQKIMKINTTSQEEIKRCMDKLEKQYGDEFREKFQSITFDNGVEFLDWSSLETSSLNESKKRTKAFYAHAYSSWERGTNENHNKMIRRFIPKGTDISKISEAKLKQIEDWMNNYPRKILGYKSPNEMVSRTYTANVDLVDYVAI